MSILELDKKGRLTLPKEIRDSLGIGKKVLIINAGDHLKIIPLPSNPFQILHGAFNKKKFKELRYYFDKNFEAIDRRFENINRRFEDLRYYIDRRVGLIERIMIGFNIPILLSIITILIKLFIF